MSEAGLRIEDSAELLAEIAATYPVTRLAHLGVDLWPIARAKLWQALTSGRMEPMRRDVAACQPLPVEPPVPHPLLLQTEPFEDARELVFRRWSIDDEARRIRHRLELQERLDVLFLARGDDLVDRFAGRPFDRHIDPLATFAEARGLRVAKVMAGERTGRRNDLAVPALTLGVDRTEFELPESDGSPILEHFTAELEARWGLVLDPWALVAQARLVRMRARAFWPLLLAARPRAVTFVCYFAPLATAMSYACRQLGIPTCDIQHGKQGIASPYSHWGRLPQAGFNTLPRWFWTWGEPSAANIRARLSHVDGGPHVLVGGNAWSAMWLNGREPPPDAEMEPLMARMARAARVILVTLQPIGEPFPPHLLDAVARSPKDWLWLIRLHPHMRKDAARHLAALPPAANVEAERASEAPLYALLRRASLHLTCWSSVAHEATLFSVPTGVLHPQGAGLYAAEIARGEFFDAQTAEAVLRLADRPPKPMPFERYIETDDAVIAAGLRALVPTRWPFGRSARPQYSSTR